MGYSHVKLAPIQRARCLPPYEGAPLGAPSGAGIPSEGPRNPCLARNLGPNKAPGTNSSPRVGRGKEGSGPVRAGLFS